MDRQELTRNNLSAHPGSLLLLARPRFPALAHGFGGRLPQSQNPSFLSFSASCGKCNKVCPFSSGCRLRAKLLSLHPYNGLYGAEWEKQDKIREFAGLGGLSSCLHPNL